MSKINNISQLNAAQTNNKNNGGEFLGSILSWKIKPNTVVPAQLLQAKLAHYQIPSNLHPKQIKDTVAFRRAIAKVNKLIRKENLLLRFIEKENKQGNEVLVGLVEENALIDQKELEYQNLGVVEFKSGVIFHNLQNQIPNLINHWYDFYNSYTNEDLSKMLVQFANEQGIRLTPRGGSYFVSSAKQAEVQNLKSFIAEIDSENKLSQFEIYNSPDGQKDLANIAQDNLETEIADLLEDSKSFIDTADPERATFNKGLVARNNKAKTLKHKLSMMQKVLKLNDSMIQQSLADLENVLNLTPVTPDSVKPEPSSKVVPLHQLDLMEEVGF